MYTMLQITLLLILYLLDPLNIDYSDRFQYNFHTVYTSSKSRTLTTFDNNKSLTENVPFADGSLISEISLRSIVPDGA